MQQKWWVLITIGVGTFMSALDTSVVNTVLPVIRSTFDTRVEVVEWIVIIYLLGVSGLLPIFGRLGDLRGHRLIYLSGFAGFIFTSMLCGIAQSVAMLVVFRGLQAISAAMLSANSPAILTKSFPGSQRGQALGIQATMTYLGLTVGPSLGGWLTDQFGWRYVFFINLPVGLLALLLALRFVPRDEIGERKETFDLGGALTLIVGLTLLLLVLNQGHRWGWFSLAVLVGLTASGIMWGLFLWIERHAPWPMVDLKLFSVPAFSGAIVSAVLNYICVYSIMFLMPFYLMQGRTLSASQTGLVLTAMPIVMAVVAPISGTLSDRIGTRWLTTLGMVVIALGAGFLSRMEASTPLVYIPFGLALTGMGIGIFISPNNSSLMGAAPHNRQGIAAGILATSRNVGMVLGVGLAGAVFNSVLQLAPADASSLFSAIQASFLMISTVAVLGVVISFWTGSTRKSVTQAPS
jgi:EmrB/QacA subfamily drug resistance transporter